MVAPEVTLGELTIPVPPPPIDPAGLHATPPAAPPGSRAPRPASLVDAPPSPAAERAVAATGPTRTVPLRWLAHGRSGDKGNTANIGILARRSELVAVLRAQLTAPAVKQFLGHLVLGDVRRHDWPGLRGWNFVCGDALGGGGIASLRFDPQGKALAQILLEMPITVPTSLAVTDPEAT
jgi:hypothetical protein